MNAPSPPPQLHASFSSPLESRTGTESRRARSTLLYPLALLRPRLPIVQPNGRELLSKGRTVTAPPLGPRVAGPRPGLRLGPASALRTVDWRGLTGRLQDGLESTPALGGAELVGIGEVVLRRRSAEEGFLVLVGKGEGLVSTAS